MGVDNTELPKPPRDLNKEREELEAIIKRQPKAEQEYNRGKFRSG